MKVKLALFVLISGIVLFFYFSQQMNVETTACLSHQAEIVDSNNAIDDIDVALEEFATLDQSYNIRYLNKIALSPDGGSIVSDGADNLEDLLVWDNDRGEIVNRLSGHTQPITSIDYSPSGDMIATGSHDNSVILWNSQSGVIIRRIEQFSSDITSLMFIDDRQLIIVSPSDNLHIWDIETNTSIADVTLQNKHIDHISVNSDKTCLVVAGNPTGFSGTAYAYLVDLGTYTTERIHTGAGINAVAFHPYMDTVAIADTNITIYDLKTRETLLTLNGSIVRFHPNGQLVFTINPEDNEGNYQLHIRDNAGNTLYNLQLIDYRDIDLSEDGRFVGIVSGEGIKLWQVNLDAEVTP